MHGKAFDGAKACLPCEVRLQSQAGKFNCTCVAATTYLRTLFHFCSDYIRYPAVHPSYEPMTMPTPLRYEYKVYAQTQNSKTRLHPATSPSMQRTVTRSEEICNATMYRVEIPTPINPGY